MRALAIAFVLAVTATTAHADDDPLAEAMRLEAALDYQGALTIVERTIALGSADHDQLVRMHLFAGKLAAGLDRPQVAEDHFARVLALAPTTTLAEGTSPKITEPFDAARGHAVPLRVTWSRDATGVVVVADGDVLKLVEGVAIDVVDAAGRSTQLVQGRGLRIVPPAGARLVHVYALDTFGNRVWSEPVDSDHGHSSGESRLIVVRPFYARWPVWAATTAVALGAGGISAWRFETAQHDWDQLKAMGAEYTELQRIETRGRRWGLAANISFGTAAVTGVVAIIMAARGSQRTLILTTQPAGAGVALAGAW